MQKVGIRNSILGVLSLLALSACTDTAAVDDSDPVHVVGQPRFAAATIQASLPGPTSSNISTSISLPSVANPTIAYLEVSGDIYVYDNYQNIGALVGVIPPGGGHQGLQTTNCHGQVQIWYQYGGSYNVGTDCEGGVRTTPIKVHGAGSASRGSNYPGVSPPTCPPYPYKPCYYYSGGAQSITITPINMDLKLKPSKYVVTSGMSVTFTAFGTPDSVYPYKLPFAVQSWQWTPDNGSASAACTAGVTACAKTLTSSGTMMVTALVNGEIATASVHVRVVCAFTGDSLLDNLPVLDAMEHAWEGSFQGAPADRQEWSWSVSCDSDGVCRPEWWVEPGATPCRTTFPEEYPDGRTRPVEGHTHPVIPSGYPGHPPEPLPPSCPRKPMLNYPPNAPRYGTPGPSPDFDLKNSPGRPLGRTECIIDIARIYCWPAGVPASTAEDQMLMKWRNENGCSIVLNDDKPSMFSDFVEQLYTEVV